ncbi:hypothetical protein [Enterococcus sp. HY326]|uniref:hypothetical protein n=1 Tax=Enterococcus sp. HY326 TaxID=2971265 RepID=UPI0022402891|nr:hypothetical protein [Enterococcus sp. HY326]
MKIVAGQIEHQDINTRNDIDKFIRYLLAEVEVSYKDWKIEQSKKKRSFLRRLKRRG